MCTNGKFNQVQNVITKNKFYLPGHRKGNNVTLSTSRMSKHATRFKNWHGGSCVWISKILQPLKWNIQWLASLTIPSCYFWTNTSLVSLSGISDSGFTIKRCISRLTSDTNMNQNHMNNLQITFDRENLK